MNWRWITKSNPKKQGSFNHKKWVEEISQSFRKAQERVREKLKKTRLIPRKYYNNQVEHSYFDMARLPGESLGAGLSKFRKNLQMIIGS